MLRASCLRLSNSVRKLAFCFRGNLVALLLKHLRLHVWPGTSRSCCNLSRCKHFTADVLLASPDELGRGSDGGVPARGFRVWAGLTSVISLLLARKCAILSMSGRRAADESGCLSVTARCSNRLRHQALLNFKLMQLCQAGELQSSHSTILGIEHVLYLLEQHRSLRRGHLGQCRFDCSRITASVPPPPVPAGADADGQCRCGPVPRLPPRS